MLEKDRKKELPQGWERALEDEWGLYNNTQ
jgi:hypothetical protein